LHLIDAVTGPRERTGPGENRSNQSAAQATNEANIKGDQTMLDSQETATADVAPLAAERKRVLDIKTAFPNDPSFVLEAIAEGWTVTEAKAQRCDRLEQARAAEVRGDTGVPFGEGSPMAPANFLEQAREMAEEKNISVTQAMQRLATKNPALHQKFLAAESQRPLTVHGRGKAAGRVSL
jgi:hypothetical protein